MTRPFIDPAMLRAIMEPEVKLAKIIEAEAKRGRDFGTFLASIGRGK